MRQALAQRELPDGERSELIVGVGVFQVMAGPIRLVCLGLGSCLAIALCDIEQRTGGLAHAMLPRYEEGRDRDNPAKFVDTSIYLMVDQMLELGCRQNNLRAKIVGGAQMFRHICTDLMDIGLRNIETAREVLKKEGIPIQVEQVGGTIGRTVSFDPSNGDLLIRSLGADLVRI
jgi:chemotaxis protein CheD